MSDHAVSSVVCVAAVMVLAVVSIGARPADPDALMARAKALQKAVPLIDGHNDFPWALREKSPERNLDALDLRTHLQPPIMTAIPRLRAGGDGGGLAGDEGAGDLLAFSGACDLRSPAQRPR